MELIFASNGFKIYSRDNKYSVFRGQDEIDTFASYAEASRTVQDLFISSQVHPDDPMIGVKAFCPDAMGSGNIVLVIGKSLDGYFVQKAGGGFRMEATGEHLSEVPSDMTGAAPAPMVPPPVAEGAVEAPGLATADKDMACTQCTTAIPTGSAYHESLGTLEGPVCEKCAGSES